MELKEAIVHAKEVAASKCDECGKEHAQLAEWLQELVAFKDETPITEEWLQANGFSEGGWMKIGDNIIRCYETGRARWFACIDNDDRNFHDKFGRVKTVGQLRMFLTLCGLGDFAKQLKS